MAESNRTIDFLHFCLKHFRIKLLKESAGKLYLEKGYCIEIEGSKLFKLLHQGQVVAPFSDVEEMCSFIHQDMQLQDG